MRRRQYYHSLPEIRASLADLSLLPAVEEVPSGCRICPHYVAGKRECEVLNVLLADCFVVRQANANAARGIFPK